MKIETIEKKPCFVIRRESGYTPYLAFHQNDIGNFVLVWIENLGKRTTITLSPKESADLVEWIIT